MPPLDGMLVVDLTRYLPGPFASRELLRHGARVVRVESPDGDPMRKLAPAWDDALNAGKESVVCDLKADAGFGRALCSHADVVLEGFRPGVAERLGIGPSSLPGTVVYCSLTGFGAEGRHATRAGHDLNYLGYAGVLADTAPALPPVQIADLAAGALAAVAEILAALFERSRTGKGRHIVMSLTHGSHQLVAHRLGGDPIPQLLTGGLARYGIYETADGRFLTVAALEERFARRLGELLEVDVDDADALARSIASRTLDEWLELFEDEDVSVGPVWTPDEAARDFAYEPPPGHAPALGEHTDAWRRELGYD